MIEKNKTIIIGHANSGKTTLSAAIINSLENIETKTIHEIIEEQQSIKITAPPKIDLINWDFKSGKQSRRDRRAKERKSKKNK
jgi:predicted ATPase